MSLGQDCLDYQSFAKGKEFLDWARKHYLEMNLPLYSYDVEQKALKAWKELAQARDGFGTLVKLKFEK